MGAKFDSDDDEGIIAGINITPMVDIMLVLLIIFMLTASVIEDYSLKVELPEAATARETEKSTIGITIDGEGTWYLNGEETQEEALRAFIRAEREKVEEIHAIIAADTTVPYGEVVHVIDVVKQEGVTQFALNTDPNAVLPGPFPPAAADEEPTEEAP